jgi:histidinol dehydrogenase
MLIRTFDTSRTPLAKIAQAIGAAPPVGTPAEQAAVADIVEAVRTRGDAALLEYTRRFDWPRATVSRLRATRAELKAAPASLSARDREALQFAISRVRRYHEGQRPADSLRIDDDGSVIGNRFVPLDSVGVYATVASSLIMAAVPAQVAGVRRIAVATPPGRDGKGRGGVFAAASLLGLTEVYKVGGAQAIAALGLGTKALPAVDKVVGAGNIYVTIAKRMLYGTVGIDGLYGPSELTIIADETASPEWLAADLAAQAEHVPVVGSLPVVALVSPSKRLIRQTRAALKTLLADLKQGEKTARAISQGGAFVIVRDLRQAAALSNLLAPEHLQISVREPLAILTMIRHAGCIVLGHQTTVPIGDYAAGPSHVLPTGRSARFSSGLHVSDFVKRSSVIAVSPGWLDRYGALVERLAMLEGLQAHARAISARRAR